jgi:glycine/D-amino acid oxidase-like deaminating enzyme
VVTGIVQNARQPNKPFGLMSWCKAGYSLDGKWKNIGRHGQYLYPVHQLSEAFKGRFLDSLKRALRKQNELFLFNDRVQQAYQTKWVVHCEPSLASAEHVVRYLGQYTHRVAITNQRILDIAGGKVTFIAKDRLFIFPSERIKPSLST